MRASKIVLASYMPLLLVMLVLALGFAAVVAPQLPESPGTNQATSQLITIDQATSGIVKFKILNGVVVDKFMEDGGEYYVFFNMQSFREEFAPWLVYMALTKDREWWVKEFSEKAARAAERVRKHYQEYSLIPLKPEDVWKHRKEIAASINEWWFYSFWDKVIGSCVPSVWVKVMIEDKVYNFHPIDGSCVEQYDKVSRLGGRFDLTVIWVSNELRVEQKDLETIPGWHTVFGLDSGLTRKLLSVIRLVGFWDKAWIPIQIASAGYGVGGEPVYPGIPDFQYYNTSKGVNVKNIVGELIEKFPDAVKIDLPSSNTDAIVFVKLTRLGEVVEFLRSKGVQLGVPTSWMVILR